MTASMSDLTEEDITDLEEFLSQRFGYMVNVSATLYRTEFDDRTLETLELLVRKSSVYTWTDSGEKSQGEIDDQ